MRGDFSASNRRRVFDVVDRFWTVVDFQKALVAVLMVMSFPVAPIKRVTSLRIALEHQVTAEDAMISALGIVPELMVNPGCKECSKSNETYCLGRDVIYDHCCCDRRFHESIPYVEHSCYIETTPCEPIVRDCGEYMKMMSCCCHRLLGTKWKNISMALAGERKLHSSSTMILVATAVVSSLQSGIL